MAARKLGAVQSEWTVVAAEARRCGLCREGESLKEWMPDQGNRAGVEELLQRKTETLNQAKMAEEVTLGRLPDLGLLSWW